MEKRKPSCTAGGNANQCRQHEKQYGGSFKKLKIRLSYDLAVWFLRIHAKEKQSVQLTLEQHRFELHSPSYMQIYYMIHGWWNPRMWNNGYWGLAVKLCTGYFYCTPNPYVVKGSIVLQGNITYPYLLQCSW